MQTFAYKKIFMLGIGGHGMRALALLLHAKGAIVRGADRDFKNLKNQALMRDYELSSEEKAQDLLADSDILIFSDAVVSDHPLRVLAQAKHIHSMSYIEALGDFAQDFKVIAVTGTHGKSSTTALLSHILIEAGLDPSVLIGAPVPAWNNQNARVGQSEYLVLEADEYREHFLTLRPLHGIITSIDFDHPDYYKDLEHVKSAYGRFIAKINEDGYLVIPGEFKAKYPDIMWNKNTISPGENINLDNIQMILPGKHMQDNATLAVALAEKMGVEAQDAIASLKSFKGLGRRFEHLGSIDSMKVISDYGHHPDEISATSKAGREKYPKSKIAVMVEIHMPERLETFFDGYVSALQGFDTILFPPVFMPKGRDAGHNNTEILMQKLQDLLEQGGARVVRIQNYDDLEGRLNDLAGHFDYLLCFSAGILDSKLRHFVNNK